eukprot:SAG31_NODE_1357_length_8647_cov_8.257838_10_plen_142_part_00
MGDDEVVALAGELQSGWEPRDWLAIGEALNAEAAASAAYSRKHGEPIIPEADMLEPIEEALVSEIVANDTNRAQNTGWNSSKSIDEARMAGSVAREHNQTSFSDILATFARMDYPSVKLLATIGILEDRQMMMTTPWNGSL